MFTKSMHYVVCFVALGLGLILTACQPIQSPDLTGESNSPVAKRIPGGPTVAFVHERSLYIHPGDLAVTVEDCAIGCHVYYATWSPDGKRLAYFYSPATAEKPFEIRLTSLSGQVQTVAAGVGWITPPAWSPLGDRLAYLVATDRYVVQDEIPRYLLEVWTTDVSKDGTMANARKHGEVSIGGDCGGGGRSESAMLYETEGGLSYGGYLAGILAWSAEDLLLYSNNCTAHGVGRFDLSAGEELEPYAGKLRSLSLNRERTGWVAIDEHAQLVLGSPAAVDYRSLTTQTVPELVFYSQTNDDIFYTTLTVMDQADLFDGLSETQQNIPVSPYFEFTQPELHIIHPSGDETLLWKDDAYAYARVQQSADGSLYFARVSDSKSLFTALNEGTLTVDNVDKMRPTVDVLRLRPGNDRPEVWLPNATQVVLAPVSTPVASAMHDCPSPTATTQLLQHDVYGYCFLYPANYEVIRLATAYAVAIWAPPETSGHRERLLINVEDAGNRTLADATQQFLADYSLPGLPITVTHELMGHGEVAVQIEPVPGQELSRHLLLIHDRLLYDLTFLSADPTQSEAYAQMETLYTRVIQSFTLIPRTE